MAAAGADGAQAAEEEAAQQGVYAGEQSAEAPSGARPPGRDADGGPNGAPAGDHGAPDPAYAATGGDPNGYGAGYSTYTPDGYAEFSGGYGQEYGADQGVHPGAQQGVPYGYEGYEGYDGYAGQQGYPDPSYGGQPQPYGDPAHQPYPQQGYQPQHEEPGMPGQGYGWHDANAGQGQYGSLGADDPWLTGRDEQ